MFLTATTIIKIRSVVWEHLKNTFPGHYFQCTGKYCKGQIVYFFVQNGLVFAGCGFLSYCNHQIIKFKEDKRFGL